MREVYSTQLAAVVGALLFTMAVSFALLQSPGVLVAPVRPAASLPHPVEGHERCDACHGLQSELPYPVRHLGWSNESCTRCHSPS